MASKCDFDAETWQALDLLSRDSGKSVQELANEASPSVSTARNRRLRFGSLADILTSPRHVRFTHCLAPRWSPALDHRTSAPSLVRLVVASHAPERLAPFRRP
jgi:hypothetical protein